MDVIRLLADEPEDVRPDLTLFQRKGGAPTVTSAPPPARVIADSTTTTSIFLIHVFY